MSSKRAYSHRATSCMAIWVCARASEVAIARLVHSSVHEWKQISPECLWLMCLSLEMTRRMIQWLQHVVETDRYGAGRVYTCPKIWNSPFYYLLMCLNIAVCMANSLDPDQMPYLLSIPILRVIMVLYHIFFHRKPCTYISEIGSYNRHSQREISFSILHH